jgi:hypothetical protein
MLGRSQPGPVKPSPGLPHQICCRADRERFPLFVGSGPLSRCSIKNQAQHTNRRSSVNLVNLRRSDLLSVISDKKRQYLDLATATPTPHLHRALAAMESSSSLSKIECMN